MLGERVAEIEPFLFNLLSDPAMMKLPGFVQRPLARRISRTKPIMVVKSGRTASGAKAAISHTGSLAGPDKLYDGVFRQSGIIRARSIEEMFDFCYALGSSPLPAGNRVIIQTHSGGPGAAAADACSRFWSPSSASWDASHLPRRSRPRP